MHTFIAIIAAVAAGAGMAGEGLLQQGAASAGPAGEDTRSMATRLVHSTRWWAGLVCAFAAFGLQALALTFGPLALVQPVIVSEMLFAVPLSARRRGVRLGFRAWISVVAVVAGLGVGIGLARPRQGDPLAAQLTEWAWALGAVAAVTTAALAVTRLASGPVRASLYALAGAGMLGLQSALFDATIQLLQRDRFGVFAHWQAYALIVVSFAGLGLIQAAYKAGPLPASLPVIDAVLPATAIALGMGLFGETVNTSWSGLTGAGVGLALLIGGIIGLDTSRTVRRQQRIEDQQQRRQGDPAQP